MQTPLALLRFIAKAVGNAFGAGIAGDLLVEVLPEVAKDIWDWWGSDRDSDQRRTDIEAIIQANFEEIERNVSHIVREEVPQLSSARQEEVAAYLMLVPASICRSFRRQSDPGGMSVPQRLVPKSADDLIPLLPPRLPRLKRGDRPSGIGDWQLEQLLGVGGFGEVWKAKNHYMQNMPPVALKFCLDPSAARILRNEVAVLDQVMRQGKHEGIVELHRTHLGAETPCLEYQYVEGGNLADLMQRRHRETSGFSPTEAAKIICRLAQIMGFAHRLSPPIVHRDLKPANVLIKWLENGEPVFKISDFGIGGVASKRAIQEESFHKTSQGHFLVSAVRGSFTPLYAPPEQIAGALPDPRNDVFALGVIWYQLLTLDMTNGKPGGDRWKSRLAGRGMRSDLIELLGACIEDELDDRPRDAQVLADQIARFTDGVVPPPPPGPILYPLPEIPSSPPPVPSGLKNRLILPFERGGRRAFLVGSDPLTQNVQIIVKMAIWGRYSINVYDMCNKSKSRVSLTEVKGTWKERWMDYYKRVGYEVREPFLQEDLIDEWIAYGRRMASRDLGLTVRCE